MADATDCTLVEAGDETDFVLACKAWQHDVEIAVRELQHGFRQHADRLAQRICEANRKHQPDDQAHGARDNHGQARRRDACLSLGAIVIAIGCDHFDEIIDGCDCVLTELQHRERGRKFSQTPGRRLDDLQGCIGPIANLALCLFPHGANARRLDTVANDTKVLKDTLHQLFELRRCFT